MNEREAVEAGLPHLPGAAALFDETGCLVRANQGFDRLAGDHARQPEGFYRLFGARPAELADTEDAIFGLADRHYSAAVSPVGAGDWLCHLTDVTGIVARQVAAHARAERDPLTQLPNRISLLPEVRSALADERRDCAVMMIDLDRFKAVNDTLGHHVGDALLVKVAERLRSCTRATDRVARLGGDEFAIVQTGSDQPEGAQVFAKRLVDVIGRAYLIGDHMVDVGCSIGVAIAPRGQSADAETLVKQADMALNRAKQSGRGRYTFFEQEMDDAMQARRVLEADLRRALAFRQFELYYQPQIRLSDEGVVGMEALIRWNHPDRGQVQPAGFLGLAEETGLIIPIGEWVIRQACADASQWADEVTVCVNVSARQLTSPKLVATVASALAARNLPPARLEVEVTESVMMSDLPGCLATLHGLKALGVRIAMDDFGTGYSSLSHLRSFPFDKIKIDQSFVRTGDAAKNESIVRAITAMGEHLGMQTIAEGVETEEQLRELMAHGCGSAQGYLISPPVPLAQAIEIGRGYRSVTAAPQTLMPVVAAEAEAPLDEQGLYRLVYYSRNAIVGLEEEVDASVRQILRTSQHNNRKVGVTGALLFTDGQFAQILEGSREQVERVFDRIQLDERHHEVKLLSFEPVAKRDFSEWSMAFVGASGAHADCARESGFNPAAADANEMAAHLRRLLAEEEGFANVLAA